MFALPVCMFKGASGGGLTPVTVAGLRMVASSSQSVQVADSDDFTVDEITLSIWLKDTLANSGPRVVLRNRGLGAFGSQPGFVLELDQHQIGSNTCFEDSAGNYIYIDGPAGLPIPKTSYQHLSMTYGAGVLKVYRNAGDGAYATLNSGSPGVCNCANPVNIGQIASSRYFDGDMASVKIFNRALTQSEITELYNLGNPKHHSLYSTAIKSACVCALEMGENVPSAGEEYTDQSGNGNGGTPVNSPTFVGSNIEFGI